SQVTFNYTGAMQTYIVPPGITSIAVEMTGAEGGKSTGFAHIAGKGGSIETTMSVTPGATLNIFVGQKGNNGVSFSIAAGGWNGGGNGANNGSYAGGAGGGATDIRIGGTALTDRVLVAGAGGGAAYNYGSGDNGGNGGGLVGANGSSGSGSYFGYGGSQVAGGAGGAYPGWGAGGSGGLGTGGNGGTSTSGGGGGAGYYGGGGGSWTGAGGGSNYADGAICSGTTSLQGTNSGNGQVTITPLCAGLDLDISGDTYCEGEIATFSALSLTGGTVTWDGGVVNGVPFAPPVGLTTYTATSTSPEDCGYEIEVLVNEYPTVIAGVSGAAICDGSSVVFSGSGADTYVWDMGVVDGTPFTPAGLGTVTYTVIGYDETGCDGTASVDVTVNPVPSVTASVSSDEICEGESITLTVSGDADSYEWDPADVTPGVPYTPADGVDTYTVTGYFDATGCSTDDVITITLNPTPSISASAGDGTFCADEPLVLANGGDPDIVTWSPTDLLPGPGTYTYTATGIYEGIEGCPATATVEITVVDLPTVTASAEYENVCVGQEVVLTGAGATEYSWSPGAISDGDGFMPGGAGTYVYTVHGTDDAGCSAEEDITITVTELATLEYTMTKTTGEDDGTIDLTVTGGIAPFTFDWNNDESGDFDDTEDLSGLSAGAYKVIVKGASGCTNSIVAVVGTEASIDQLSKDMIQLYPNPTSDVVTIQIAGNFNYTLTDISGATLLNGYGNNSKTLSLDEFATGIYFVTLNVAGETVTMKVVKH
ncbi:glycine-rich protein, partial [Crocinitomix sp.]|nr:glycine-rich protein [Crocinitomix sp.]